LWLLAVGVPAAALADREVTIPQGKKIRDGVWRAEALFGGPEEPVRAWLGTGFAESFELEWSGRKERGSRQQSSLDVSYNYAPPIIDLSPGLSLGIQDSFNVTPEGRALYVATTFRFGNLGELNQDVPTELTLGVWSRSSGLVFVGASLPFSEQVVMAAEHDSRRLAGVLEIRPLAGVRLKCVFETEGTLFGISLSRRF
jgi:hypothetical protein